jgi:hypothetical protein
LSKPISLDIALLRLYNQHIIRQKYKKPDEVVGWLGAVQAQDYLGSLWAIGLRAKNVTEEDIKQAIINKSIIRTWPMRGTLHFVKASDLRWMLTLLTPRIIGGSAGRFRQLGLDEATFKRSKKLLIKALQGGRMLTRNEMYQLLEQCKISTAGQRGYHILWRLAQDGLICLGPRKDKQQTIMLIDDWIPQTKSLKRDEALAELTKRYFTGHGPATLQDFVWWSGLAIADARAGLEMVKPQLTYEVVNDRTYWISQSMPVIKDVSPTAYLLPGFDEYIVGYKNRRDVLNTLYAKKVNPGNGMLSPSIVVDGQVVGTWKRSFRKETVIIAAKVFSKLSKEKRNAVTAAAKHYSKFVGMPEIEFDKSKF